jgi:hypothetical protein
MRERIKDTLVDQMLIIHGANHDGWWTQPETLNEVADAIMDSLEAAK